MKNTKKYSDKVVKMANYANNFGCKKSKGCFNARNCKVGGRHMSPKKRARKARKRR